MAIYAIGDIQGCYDQLQRLLERLDFDEQRDTLWFCGDLVNRGPKSLKTLRFVRGLGKAAVSVMGNHDLHLIHHADRGALTNSNQTLNSALQAPDRDELVNWLARRPFCHIDDERRALLVHAGVPPGWSPKKLAKRAARLTRDWHAVLRDSLRAPAPTMWRGDLDRPDKLRYTLGALTRMRFVEEDGRLNYAHKGDPDSARDDLHPWYDFLHAKWAGYRIYFGHWSTLGETGLDNVIALDTGCVWGGRLSAARVTRRPTSETHLTCVHCAELHARHPA